jgi:hypothetical protein
LDKCKNELEFKFGTEQANKQKGIAVNELNGNLIQLALLFLGDFDSIWPDSFCGFLGKTNGPERNF